MKFHAKVLLWEVLKEKLLKINLEILSYAEILLGARTNPVCGSLTFPTFYYSRYLLLAHCHFEFYAAMAAYFQHMRPPSCFKLIKSQTKLQSQTSLRSLSTVYSQKPEHQPFPANMPDIFYTQIPGRFRPNKGTIHDSMSPAHRNWSLLDREVCYAAERLTGFFLKEYTKSNATQKKRELKPTPLPNPP